MNKCDEDYWEIIHIPDKLPFELDQQPTVDVFAAVINPKDANTIVRKLNHLSPLEDLRHVKRVRKQRLEGGVHLSMILCLAGESHDELDSMPEDIVDLIRAYQLKTFVTKVCKYAALSKEEWEEQCKLWPTSYHPPTYNIDGISGFSDKDEQSVCTFMKLALSLSTNDFQIRNAAVIVDPSSNEVIASACDQVHSWNPMTNSTSSGTGYHEPCNDTSSAFANKIVNDHSDCLDNEPQRPYDGVSCLNPWRWYDQYLGTSDCSWHPIRHAAIAAIEYSAARDRHLFPNRQNTRDALTEQCDLQSSSACSPSKKQKLDYINVKDDAMPDFCSNGHQSESVRPYLCTGYDIYFVWEPCIMCSMALVHQRIKRIFYAFPNPTAGGLGSVHRLQGEKSLNHHYAVFNVLVPKEVLGGEKVLGAKTAQIDQATTEIC